MKLLDTVVLVEALNADDKHHRKASTHLHSLIENPTVMVPSTTLIEFDLLMKARDYSQEERRQTWLELSPRLPKAKIAIPTPTSMGEACLLEREGMGYFDALITALAVELRAEVITDDKAISSRVTSSW